MWLLQDPNCISGKDHKDEKDRPDVPNKHDDMTIIHGQESNATFYHEMHAGFRETMQPDRFTQSRNTFPKMLIHERSDVPLAGTPQLEQSGANSPKALTGICITVINATLGLDAADKVILGTTSEKGRTCIPVAITWVGLGWSIL